MEENNYYIELFMKEKYMFPNNYLDETQELSNRMYDIYYILYGDAFRITKVSSNKDILTLMIKNITNGIQYKVEFDILNSFKVPDTSHLNIKLINNNAAIRFEYNTKGNEYLKKVNKDIFNYKEQIGCFWAEIYAKNFIDLMYKNSESEHKLKYDVLYIGKSKDVDYRLKNHSTLQKIMRDTFKNSPNKEIYIMTHSLGVKSFNNIQFELNNSIFTFGSKLDRTFKLENGVNRDSMVDIAEAMLISHFKPQYNSKLKGSDGLEKLKTYKKIGNINIKQVTFSLDLFWENAREKMILESNNIKTTTKARIINCIFNDSIKLQYEDVPDEIY